MKTLALSTMRYQHLVIELGSLLAELRSLGASYEDCERANHLIENVEPSTIGAVIHNLQSQVEDLRFAAERDGIDTAMIDRFDEIESDDLA